MTLNTLMDHFVSYIVSVDMTKVGPCVLRVWPKVETGTHFALLMT